MSSLAGSQPGLTAPVRIAFCITDLDPGGAERALVQLVTRLDRSVWQPVVICLSGAGALAQPLSEAGVPVVCLGAWGWWDIVALWRLVRELRRQRPVLLQTWLYHANLAGRIAGRLAGVQRIVAGIRVAERRGRLRLWAERATQGMVDHNVCVSSDVAEFSVRRGGLRTEKVSVIPNGVDAVEFATAPPADLREFGIPPGSRTVLFVGRLDPQKNPLLLLEAAECLHGRFPDLHVLLVGDGPLRGRISQGICERGLVDTVHLSGWRPDVPRLLRAGFAMALPSRWEGLPNVVLEGMAAGLPIVATDVEGIRELIEPGKTGFVVTSGSAREFSEKLAWLLDHPEAAREMGHRAQSVAENGFTWNAVVAQYNALYRRLASIRA